MRERRSCLNHCEPAHTGVGILNNRTGEDGTIVNLAVACYLDAITEHTVVAHHSVVTDMRALKEEVVIADNGLSVTQRTAIDDHILTDDIIVANNDVGLNLHGN